MKLMDRCRQKLPPLRVVAAMTPEATDAASSLAFSIIGYIQPFKVQGQNRGKEDENTSCFPPTLPSLLPLLLIIDNRTRTSIPAFLAVLSFCLSLISRTLIGSFFLIGKLGTRRTANVLEDRAQVSRFSRAVLLRPLHYAAMGKSSEALDLCQGLDIS